MTKDKHSSEQTRPHSTTTMTSSTTSIMSTTTTTATTTILTEPVHVPSTQPPTGSGGHDKSRPATTQPTTPGVNPYHHGM